MHNCQAVEVVACITSVSMTQQVHDDDGWLVVVDGGGGSPCVTGTWKREGADRQGLGKGTSRAFLLLECERNDGEDPCQWQVKDVRDRPSRPCQDNCGLGPDESCSKHERQVQNAKRLLTCTHAKATNKKRHLYNGRVAGRSDTAFPGVPYADGKMSA